jgi:hypothetical protein
VVGDTVDSCGGHSKGYNGWSGSAMDARWSDLLEWSSPSR